MQQVLSRLSRSPMHFNKFLDIIVDFAVSENHPEWCSRALRWLEKIFESPELAAMTKQSQSSLCRFLSYDAQMHGLRRLVDTVVENLDAIHKSTKPKLRKINLPIVDTGYIFIDDEDVNFGIPKKRFRRNVDNLKDERNVLNQSSPLSDEGDDSILDNLDDGDEVSAVSEDDGVFDVDDGSTSSLSESQLSNTISRTGISFNYTDNSGNSSEEDFEEDEEDDEDDEGEMASDSRLDVPPQPDDEEEEEVGIDADFAGSSGSEISVPVGRSVRQVRRSARIQNRR
ncbi:unnamed protein product [Hydatigera taeniaeformis]|uniref:Utp12 domain-containing protein n=1 Tax=Hydatigena taeniaeformis TaxID=6205 RepID=A0A0R3X701_HYDTA|nr:unnamed protein product [Hydatigera taeniaeformis]